jgi:hypothetical protein
MSRLTRRLAALSDSANLFVLIWQARDFRDSPELWRENREALADAISANPSPISLYFYLSTLVTAWSTLVLPFGFLMIGIAYLGDRLGAAHVGFAIGLFPNVFCLIGGADALWRRPFAKRARTLYLAAGHQLDPETRELIRIARANDGTLVLQLLIAICISVRVAV